ncbi:MAG: YecA family protein [Proteobacteria bacterium]|nr:YecA family protein [Pseudomonadota bacterium]
MSEISSERIKMPTYQEVTSALSGVSDVSASYSHGLLCGFICAESRSPGGSWIESLLGIVDSKDKKAENAKKILIELYHASFQQIHEMAFDFNLLLPDDDDSLSLRAEELGAWCEGFMVGLGLGGLTIQDGASKETRDALFHFSEISKIDYENLTISETDEKAYTEVVEYTRLAVLSVYYELAKQQKLESKPKHVMPMKDEGGRLH